MEIILIVYFINVNPTIDELKLFIKGCYISIEEFAKMFNLIHLHRVYDQSIVKKYYEAQKIKYNY